MKPRYWHKMLKLSVWPEKIETGGTRLRRGRQFQFFRPNWQFQHLCQITVSWNCPKIQLFSKNGHKNCHFIVQFQVKLGTKKKEPGFLLKTNGGFIETGGFGDVKGRRPFTSPKSPSFNEYHHWFSSFHTPRTREYRKFSPKFRWIPSYKNKINMSVFPLKPSFSHFSISFLLWIPSMSILQDNRTVAW